MINLRGTLFTNHFLFLLLFFHTFFDHGTFKSSKWGKGTSGARFLTPFLDFSLISFTTTRARVLTRNSTKVGCLLDNALN